MSYVPRWDTVYHRSWPAHPWRAPCLSQPWSLESSRPRNGCCLKWRWEMTSESIRSNATMMRPFKMKRTSIHIWFCPKPGWSKIVSNHLKSDFLIEIVLLRGIPYTPYLRPVLLWPLLLGGIHDACPTPPILDRRCPGWQFSQCSKHIVDCDSQPRFLYG